MKYITLQVSIVRETFIPKMSSISKILQIVNFKKIVKIDRNSVKHIKGNSGCSLAVGSEPEVCNSLPEVSVAPGGAVVNALT